MFIPDPFMSIVAVAALVLALVALAIGIVALRRQSRLNAQYGRLFCADDAGSVHDALAAYAAQVAATVEGAQSDRAQLATLTAQAARCLQHTGLVRFNPFADTGGDQSFALALADAQGNGLILSSLHTRGLTRVYAKPLVGWSSTYPLTDEENQAIQQAQTNRALGSEAE
ncbi:MAG: DUF4446 family protein [Anaerolineales bacterium]